METLETVHSGTKRHKKIRRHSTSLDIHAQSMRRPPEGDSIIEKAPMKLGPPPVPTGPKKKVNENKSVAAMKRRKRRTNMSSDSGLETAEDDANVKRSRSDTKSDFLTSLGPLNDISSIHPVLDCTMESTFSKKSKSKLDVTWEKAVCNARGQPDGAERSMRMAKSSAKNPESCAIIEENDENVIPVESEDEANGMVDEEEEEDNEMVEVKKMEKVEKKKKSLKDKVQGAVKKMKKLKEGKATTGKLKKGVLKRKIADVMGSSPDGGGLKKAKKSEKESKEEKKDFKKLRNNYDLIQNSKKIWEELRKHDVTVDRKTKLCAELLDMSKGKMQLLAFTHDGARVIQCLIQHGNMEQRAVAFDEMKNNMVAMSESKYAKFIVRKFLTYGSKMERSLVFKSLCGHVRRLIRHREASEIIEYAYNEYANATQRLAFLEEFYGPTFTLLKTDDAKSLEDVLNLHPKKKDMILANMKETLVPLIEKNILTHSIIHRLFYEYFLHADSKARSEMISELRETVVNMVHSRDGARVAMKCIWHGNTKDRKAILKSFKGFVLKMSKEEYGHQVLLSIFDVVDDTKLVSKIILEELLKTLKEVAMDTYGRKVLLYLLSPRDPMHFHPDVVKVMQEGDTNEFSKKDTNVRHDELLDVVSKPLLKIVIDNTKELVSDNNSLLFLLTILSHAKGDTTKALEAVAEICAEKMNNSSLGDLHIVEHPAGHITLKKLIAMDKEKMKNKESVLFSNVLMNTVPESVLKSWAACNRGCFILLALLELGNPEVTAQLLPTLATMKKSLKMLKFKGAQLLHDNILYNTKDD